MDHYQDLIVIKSIHNDNDSLRNSSNRNTNDVDIRDGCSLLLGLRLELWKLGLLLVREGIRG